RSKRDWSSDVCSSDLLFRYREHRTAVAKKLFVDRCIQFLELESSIKTMSSHSNASSITTMTTQEYGAPATSARLALIALSLGGFGIGLTEFVIAGLLTEVSSDLGVSITTAG